MAEDGIGRLAANLHAVEERMHAACRRSGRSRDSVRLLAVTKQRPLEELVELYRLGLQEFGENRVQEIRERIPALGLPIACHLIGHLQGNKAKYLPGLVTCIHSVDKADLADAIQKAWLRDTMIPPVDVLLQFNISGEEQKFGAGADEALALLRHCLTLDRLRVVGLMTMAPYSDDPELSRPVFRELRRLRDHLEEQSGHPLPQLSMGMTGDFEVAIEEGSTIVRVGTALFV